jgi:hypothetical protein
MIHTIDKNNKGKKNNNEILSMSVIDPILIIKSVISIIVMIFKIFIRIYCCKGFIKLISYIKMILIVGIRKKISSTF